MNDVVVVITKFLGTYMFLSLILLTFLFGDVYSSWSITYMCVCVCVWREILCVCVCVFAFVCVCVKLNIWRQLLSKLY